MVAITSEIRIMNRLTWLICTIVILLPLAIAQRGRGHGAAGGYPGAGGSESDELTDFKQAIALQATPDQTALHQLANTMQAARNDIQDLRQFSESTSLPDHSYDAGSLTGAVADAQARNEQFLRSFSTSQKDGLSATKRLDKASPEVTKQSRALARDLQRKRSESKQVAIVRRKVRRGAWRSSGQGDCGCGGDGHQT